VYPTDKKANNKSKQQSVPVSRLDNYFYTESQKKNYSKNALISILDKLLGVTATTPEIYATFIKQLSKEEVK
jgi:hypothetical protein